MLFVKNQCMRINGTLDLISQRRIMDKPSKHQLKLAKDSGCKELAVGIETVDSSLPGKCLIKFISVVFWIKNLI